MLSPRLVRWFWILSVCAVLSAVIQAFSVAVLMPFITLVALPDGLNSDEMMQWVQGWLGEDDHNSALIKLGLLVLALFFFAIVFTSATLYGITRFTADSALCVSRAAVRHRLESPYEESAQLNSSELVALVSNQCMAFGQYCGYHLHLAVSCALAIAMVSVVLISDPLVGGGAMAITLLSYVGFHFAIRRPLRKAGEELLQSTVQRTQAASELARGHREAIVFHRREFFFQRFWKWSVMHRNALVRSMLYASLPPKFMELLVFGLILGVTFFFLGARDDAREGLPLLAVFAAAGRQLLAASTGIFTALAKMRSSAPTVSRFAERIGTDRDWIGAPDFKESQDSSPAIIPEAGDRSHEICFEGVGFRYQGTDENVLQDLSFTIAAGSKIAFVGASGAGKSTAMDLILGLLSPREGRVLIGGKELDSPEAISNWRGRLGYVPQDIHLFDDTIAANIAFGRGTDQSEMELLEKAARDAQIHDFISRELPNGYRTRVGEEGVFLSGGQKQRIGIARALYGNPAVLVLDEATSAMDAAGERALFDSLKQNRPGLTVIMIAHRLSAIRGFDWIYQFSRGRIVESGSIDDLQGASEEFLKFVQLQTLESK